MVQLQNGTEVPSIGLGANGIWGREEVLQSELAKQQYEIYCYALQSGKCKLFDTSGAYGYNEFVLGNAIHDAGDRNKIKIISRVSNQAQREKNIRAAIEKSLHDLQTDYIDIYMFHWPHTGLFVDTYLQMEKLYEEGLIKAIGICNCNIHHIEEIMERANIPPMINEFELHPMFTQDSLVNYCYAHDIKIVAYTPIARMHDVLIKSKPIYYLALKYNKSPAQIILRWHYQKGYIAIPSTKNKEHFDQFYNIFDFELNDKEIAWISSLNENLRLRYNPDHCDFTRLG